MAHNRFKPTLKDVRYVRTLIDKLKLNGMWILPAWGLQYQKVGTNKFMLLKERVPPIIPSKKEDVCSEEEIIEMPNGYQNVQDCLDTTWAILQSVLEKYNGRTLTLNSTFVRINPLPSFEPILEEGNSGVCGWLGSVTFEIVSNADKC